LKNGIWFSAKQLSPGKYIKLVVQDNGSGMKKDTLDRIFEPYFTTKGVGEGSGIGLAVVHGIVENHGGAIVCESSVGVGTIFTILIPAHEGPVKEEFGKQNMPLGNGERILYVDDEPSIAKLGRRRLESLGYDVFSTTDPAEALELIKTNPGRFDLVISDMAMPKMPGDKLITEILAVNPEIPAIICTGYSSRVSEPAASGIGVKAFLMKPLNKSELAEKVREVLDKVKCKNQN
jgi:CheY-like chemotaxis protein